MSKLAVDSNANAMQVLRPSSTEKVAISTSAASATAVADNVNVLRMVSDIDCFYTLEGTATVDDVYLPADTVEYIKVYTGDVVSIIAGASGSIHITDML